MGWRAQWGTDFFVFPDWGIYHGGDPHWLTGKDYAIGMSLKLFDRHNKLIIDWDPDEPQWWITGFNPQYQGVVAEELTALYKLDFPDRSGFFEELYKKMGCQ